MDGARVSLIQAVHEPNQALEPTIPSVMPRAFVCSSDLGTRIAFRSPARGTPAGAVAHLWRSAKKLSRPPLFSSKDELMNSTAPVISGLLGLFLLACTYSTQYWAKKCYDELKEIKEELKRRS